LIPHRNHRQFSTNNACTGRSPGEERQGTKNSLEFGENGKPQDIVINAFPITEYCVLGEFRARMGAAKRRRLYRGYFAIATQIQAFKANPRYRINQGKLQKNRRAGSPKQKSPHCRRQRGL